MSSHRARIDRFLSKELQVSLKAVRLLLVKKKVTVNGKVIDEPQSLVDKFSEIICDGYSFPYVSPTYIVMNKPVGVVSATKDSQHTTVLDLITHPQKDTLHIVGRLDLNSSGLLLLTNDSRWSERLMSPEFKVEKHYRVEVKNALTKDYIDAFKQGMFFEYEGVTTAPVSLDIISNYVADVALTEGRYHQIKRMFGRFRNTVLALHRYQIGALIMEDSLMPGQWRVLSEEEFALLH